MEKYYIVKSIDGDYANLVDENEPDGETKLVARALLPEYRREQDFIMRSCNMK